MSAKHKSGIDPIAEVVQENTSDKRPILNLVVFEDGTFELNAETHFKVTDFSEGIEEMCAKLQAYQLGISIQRAVIEAVAPVIEDWGKVGVEITAEEGDNA